MIRIKVSVGKHYNFKPNLIDPSDEFSNILKSIILGVLMNQKKTKHSTTYCSPILIPPNWIRRIMQNTQVYTSIMVLTTVAKSVAAS